MTTKENPQGADGITVTFAQPPNNSDLAPSTQVPADIFREADSSSAAGSMSSARSTNRSNELSPADRISVTFANENREVPAPQTFSTVENKAPKAAIIPSASHTARREGINKSISEKITVRPRPFLTILRCRISTYHGKRGRNLVRTIADTTKEIAGLASGGGVGVAKYWIGKLAPTFVEYGAARLGYSNARELGEKTSNLIDGVLSFESLRKVLDGSVLSTKPFGLKEAQEAIEGLYGTINAGINGSKEATPPQSSAAISPESGTDNANIPLITPRPGDTI